jgi:hypothetical protein
MRLWIQVSTWVSTLVPILLHSNYRKWGKCTTAALVYVDEGDKLTLSLLMLNINFLTTVL